MDPRPSRAARTASLVLSVLLWLAVLVGVLDVAHRLTGFGQESSVLTLNVAVTVEDMRLGEELVGAHVPVSADIGDPTLNERLLATAPALASWALVIVVLWLVRAVARSAARGAPFERANVTRLRWLGALFLLGFPIVTILQGVFTEWLFREGVYSLMAPEPVRLGEVYVTYPWVSPSAIMAACGFFVLAEVFAYGARLREDVDATI